MLLVFGVAVLVGGEKPWQEPIFNSPFDPGQEGANKPQAVSSAASEKFTNYVMQGFAAEGKNNYAAAFDSYSKALEINKESVTGWIRRGYVAAKLGKYEAAAQDLKQGTNCMPVSVTDYLTLAWFRATCPFATMRDGTQAVAYAFKALREQESADAYDMLAAGYAEMGNYGKAQENIRMAIKRYPESGRLQMLKDHLELYKNRQPWRTTWGAGEDQIKKTVDSAAN